MHDDAVDLVLVEVSTPVAALDPDGTRDDGLAARAVPAVPLLHIDEAEHVALVAGDLIAESDDDIRFVVFQHPDGGIGAELLTPLGGGVLDGAEQLGALSANTFHTYVDSIGVQLAVQ